MSLLSDRPSLFGRILSFLSNKPKTAGVAKERLQIILAHERTSKDTSRPKYLPDLQRELLSTISKYVSVNLTDVKINIGQHGNLEVLEVKVELPDAITASGNLPGEESFLTKISHLDHLVLTTTDEAACVYFYQTVLGMTLETFGINKKALRFGNQKIDLQVIRAKESNKAAHLQYSHYPSGGLDLCFIVSTSLDRVVDHLLEMGIPIIEGPTERSGALGTIRSIYIRDPDQNLIELSEQINSN